MRVGLCVFLIGVALFVEVGCLSLKKLSEESSGLADPFYFYVSPSGADSNPGTKDKPFASIQKAQQVVRVKKTQWNGNITVLLRQGTYFVNSTLFFSQEDSGNSATSRISYQAYPTAFSDPKDRNKAAVEQVIISGGKKFPNQQWTLFKSSWSAENGLNNIYEQVPSPGVSTDTIKYVGSFSTVDKCQQAIMNSNFTFKSYTYHSSSLNSGFRSMCYGRLDSYWQPTEEGQIMSGRPYQIYSTPLPTDFRQLPFDSLFINEQRMWRARFPNVDSTNPRFDGTGYRSAVQGIGGSNRQKGDPTLYPAKPTSGMIYDATTFSTRIGSWTNTNESVVHVFPQYYWGNLQYKISKVFTNNQTLIFGSGGGQINLYKFDYGSDIDSTSRYFVENVLQELDAPGEYYVDRQNNVLFVIPPASVTNLSNATLIVPILEHIIRTQGEPLPADTADPSIYVSHLTFSGLIFRHSTPTYMKAYEVPSDGDWTIHRGGAFFIEQSSDIVVDSCVFDQLGGNAVFISGAARQVQVSQSECKFAGDSCIALVGYRSRSIGSQQMFPSDCLILNNHLHHFGVYGKQTAGVFVSIARRIRISGNLIYNMPRAAILINDGFSGGHIVEYNEAYDCVLETSDHACFNSWGRTRFWPELFNHPYVDGVPDTFPAGPVTIDVIESITVRNNLFVYPVDTLNGVIDMDDGTSNYLVYENVCVGGAIKIGSTGDIHYVYNNIFYDALEPAFFWLPMVNNDDHFVRNIVVLSSQYQSQNPAPLHRVWGTLFPKEINYNAFLVNEVPLNKTTYYIDHSNQQMSLADWKAKGYDTNSLFNVDPQFYDPLSANFTLRSTSPVLKLGFHNFAYGPQYPTGPLVFFIHRDD